MLSRNHSIGVGAPRRQVQDFSETRYWLCNSFQIQVMQAQQSLFHKLTTVTNFLAAKIIFTTTLRNTFHARILGVIFARQCGPSINVLIPIKYPCFFSSQCWESEGQNIHIQRNPIMIKCFHKSFHHSYSVMCNIFWTTKWHSCHEMQNYYLVDTAFLSTVFFQLHRHSGMKY